MRSSPFVLFTSIAIVSGLALVLTAVEAGFTFFASCAPSGIAHDELLGWRLTKKQLWRYKSIGPEGLDVQANTNSAGLRDSEHSRTKQPGKSRIIFLGDSYTVGLEYPTDKIFTQRFAGALNQAKAPTELFDVMNVAVPAWATDQQYLYLKSEGMKYQPDYVVLMIAPNDIRESYAKRFFALKNNKLVPERSASIPWKDRAYWYLANHSCAFQRWQKAAATDYGRFAGIFRHYSMSFSVGAEMASERHLFLRDAPAEITAAKELFKSLVLAIHRLCADHHCKLLLAIIPTKIEYDGSLKDIRYQPGAVADYVETIATENNIPFLNLVRALAAEESDPLNIFITNEYHLNDRGHAFVAKHLLAFFKAYQ